MHLSRQSKLAVLIAGDLAALYGSLLLALFLRYGEFFFREFVERHAASFSIIFSLWIAVFYIAGLYDLKKLRNNIDFIKSLFFTIAVNTGIAIAIFYLTPSFGIAPKTNLFLFIGIFTVVEAWWRRSFNVRAEFREGLHRVLLVGDDDTTAALEAGIRAHPQIGYEVALWTKKNIAGRGEESFGSAMRAHRINLVVVPRTAMKDKAAAKILYEALSAGVEVRDTSSFAEIIFRKIPLADLEEAWFIEHRAGEKKFYDDLKKGLEVAGAMALFLVLLPVLVLIAFCIKMTSKGNVIYAQKRVGLHGAVFTLYKFRTMRAIGADGSAETSGPQWSAPGDARTTPIGRFLRYAHLDELPQLINIIRRDLSFVGPRPERPEFVDALKEKIPYYAMRLLVKPGITGWAQINYRYGASEEDAREKLEYDIYYLKNRSLILDAAIILKTLKSFFINHT